MKKQNCNFIVFILVLFIICIFMNRSLKESFKSEFIDVFRTEPESELINISKPLEQMGWKNFYRENYLKGDLESTDNFEGTVIRNYLDNLNFVRY